MARSERHAAPPGGTWADARDAATPCPHISVIIPTRNRPADLERCLDSLATVAYPRWDIQLVDQGDDPSARAVATRYAHRLPHLTYRPLRAPGLSRALNAGLRAAGGDIVALLDDDCTVGADWLEQVAAAFARHPRCPLVFGTVEAAAPDRQADAGYTPRHHVDRERVRRGRLAVYRCGMGASMYVRRAVLQQVGLFDVHMGAGAAFALNDKDFTYRVLAAGYSMVETPRIVVRHYGLREYASGAALRLACRYTLSQGALDMKMLRCGDPAALALMALFTWRFVRKINLLNLVLRRRPTHLWWLTMYLRGLRASFHFRVDRRRRLYVTDLDRCRPFAAAPLAGQNGRKAGADLKATQSGDAAMMHGRHHQETQQ